MAYKKEQSNSLCQGHCNFLWMEQKKNPTQMYVHRQDFLLYLLFKDVYKDKCICLNAYFLDFGAPITHQVVRTN